MVAEVRSKNLDADIAESGGIQSALETNRANLTAIRQGLKEHELALLVAGSRFGANSEAAIAARDQVALDRDTILILEGLDRLFACRAASSASNTSVGRTPAGGDIERSVQAGLERGTVAAGDAAARQRARLVDQAESQWQAPHGFGSSTSSAAAISLRNPFATNVLEGLDMCETAAARCHNVCATSELLAADDCNNGCHVTFQTCVQEWENSVLGRVPSPPAPSAADGVITASDKTRQTPSDACRLADTYQRAALRREWEAARAKFSLSRERGQELARLKDKLLDDSVWARSSGPVIALAVKQMSETIQAVLTIAAPGGNIFLLSRVSGDLVAPRIRRLQRKVIAIIESGGTLDNMLDGDYIELIADELMSRDIYGPFRGTLDLIESTAENVRIAQDYNAFQDVIKEQILRLDRQLNHAITLAETESAKVRAIEAVQAAINDACASPSIPIRPPG